MTMDPLGRLTEINSKRRAAGLGGQSVAVILPRGEAIRNFVYTGALTELAQETKLTLLSIVPNREIYSLLHKQSDEVFPLREYPERWGVGIVREILNTSHGRWLWSEAAKERWRLRDYEAQSSAQQLKRGTKKLISYLFSNPLGLEVLSKAEQIAGRWWSTLDDYLALFLSCKPSLVFNASHVHSRIALPPIHAAKKLRIPTATFIFSWDNLTSQGRIIPPYDYYLVWNEAIRTQLLNIYPRVRPNQVFVTGTPQFDFHFQPEFFWTRQTFCQHVGADPKRPIVLYSTGMANHMPGEPLIVEGIADMLQRMPELGPPQLLVRVYPKDQSGRFGTLKSRRPDILFPDVPWEPAWLTPKFEDSHLLTNTLRYSDVGINVASTISLELCMFDKPVINVGYNPPMIDISPIDYRIYYNFDHYRPIVESGAVEVATSPDEMRRLLLEALRNPKQRSNERQSLLKEMFDDTLDGRSGKRVARCLREMVAQGSTSRSPLYASER
jgi:hypothetical protein